MKQKPQAFVLALMLVSSLALAACGEDGECGHVVAGTPHALWSEFLSPAEVLDQLPRLKAHGISVYQNVTSEQVDRWAPDVGALFQEAACMGVEMRAWLTLPEDQGYWPNEKNVDIFQEKVNALAEWLSQLGWPTNWIIVDMEPGLEMMNQLIELGEKGGLSGHR